MTGHPFYEISEQGKFSETHLWGLPGTQELYRRGIAEVFGQASRQHTHSALPSRSAKPWLRGTTLTPLCVSTVLLSSRHSTEDAQKKGMLKNHSWSSFSSYLGEFPYMQSRVLRAASLPGNGFQELSHPVCGLSRCPANGTVFREGSSFCFVNSNNW